MMHANAIRTLPYGIRHKHSTRCGFRSLLLSRASKQASKHTNYQRKVCEQVLAHNCQDNAKAAYFRTDLLEKRRPMTKE